MRLAVLFLLAYFVSGDPGGKARQVSYEVQSALSEIQSTVSAIQSAIPPSNVSAAPSPVTVTTAEPQPTSETKLASNLSATLNPTDTTVAESPTTDTAETARPILFTAPTGTPTATTNIAGRESTEIGEVNRREDAGGPRGKAGVSERASRSGRNTVTDSPTRSPSADSTELTNNVTSADTQKPTRTGALLQIVTADTNLTDALTEVVPAADGRFLNDSETAGGSNVSLYCGSLDRECANGGLCYTAADASRRCLCRGEWVGETCEELGIGGGAALCGANGGDGLSSFAWSVVLLVLMLLVVVLATGLLVKACRKGRHLLTMTCACVASAGLLRVAGVLLALLAKLEPGNQRLSPSFLPPLGLVFAWAATTAVTLCWVRLAEGGGFHRASCCMFRKGRYCENGVRVTLVVVAVATLHLLATATIIGAVANTHAPDFDVLELPRSLREAPGLGVTSAPSTLVTAVEGLHVAYVVVAVVFAMLGLPWAVVVYREAGQDGVTEAFDVTDSVSAHSGVAHKSPRNGPMASKQASFQITDKLGSLPDSMLAPSASANRQARCSSQHLSLVCWLMHLVLMLAEAVVLFVSRSLLGTHACLEPLVDLLELARLSALLPLLYLAGGDAITTIATDKTSTEMSGRFFGKVFGAKSSQKKGEKKLKNHGKGSKPILEQVPEANPFDVAFTLDTSEVEEEEVDDERIVPVRREGARAPRRGPILQAAEQRSVERSDRQTSSFVVGVDSDSESDIGSGRHDGDSSASESSETESRSTVSEGATTGSEIPSGTIAGRGSAGNGGDKVATGIERPSLRIILPEKGGAEAKLRSPKTPASRRNRGNLPPLSISARNESGTSISPLPLQTLASRSSTSHKIPRESERSRSPSRNAFTPQKPLPLPQPSLTPQSTKNSPPISFSPRPSLSPQHALRALALHPPRHSPKVSSSPNPSLSPEKVPRTLHLPPSPLKSPLKSPPVTFSPRPSLSPEHVSRILSQHRPSSMRHGSRFDKHAQFVDDDKHHLHDSFEPMSPRFAPLSPRFEPLSPSGNGASKARPAPLQHGDALEVPSPRWDVIVSAAGGLADSDDEGGSYSEASAPVSRRQSSADASVEHLTSLAPPARHSRLMRRPPALLAAAAAFVDEPTLRTPTTSSPHPSVTRAAGAVPAAAAFVDEPTPRISLTSGPTLSSIIIPANPALDDKDQPRRTNALSSAASSLKERISGFSSPLSKRKGLKEHFSGPLSSPLSKSKGLKERFSGAMSPLGKSKGKLKGSAKDLSIAKPGSTKDLSVAEGSASQRKAAW